MAVEVIEVGDDAGVARARVIRFEVFVDEQDVRPDEELDDLDHTPGTVHLLAVDTDTGDDLGTVRLLSDPAQPGVVHVTRVAVRRDARRRGVGRLLMDAAEERALVDHGGGEPRSVRLELSVQEAALDFYGALGYEIGDRRYVSARIWHRDAVRVVTER
ncbi:MAG TPA: GNAT family N-acetyltransferase [Acidimicrobiales bacterium]|nr:GNAT family N-acetyltransferase [Acidimicrobiales bacterium]